VALGVGEGSSQERVRVLYGARRQGAAKRGVPTFNVGSAEPRQGLRQVRRDLLLE